MLPKKYSMRLCYVILTCLLLVFACKLYLSKKQRSSSEIKTGSEQTNAPDEVAFLKVSDAENAHVDKGQLSKNIMPEEELIAEEIYKEMYNEIGKAHSELRENQEKDNMEKIEKEQRAIQYNKLKGQPQVVWGVLKLPGFLDRDPNIPLVVAICPSKRVPLHTCVVDDQLRFALPAVSPGQYRAVLLETSETPGIRFENLVIEANKSMPEIIIESEDSIVDVVVKDDLGSVVGDAEVAIVKSGGGTHENIYMFKNGFTDSNGMFSAKGLTDGRYLVYAKRGNKDEKVGEMIELGRQERVKVELIAKTEVVKANETIPILN